MLGRPQQGQYPSTNWLARVLLLRDIWTLEQGKYLVDNVALKSDKLLCLCNAYVLGLETLLMASEATFAIISLVSLPLT